MLGFTGPRSLTPAQVAAVMGVLDGLDNGAVLVGCAAGVDDLVWHWAGCPQVFSADQENPAMPVAAKLQARSKRMVRALANAGGTLHAFPNKPCPAGLTRDKWMGSGTWGTMAYAVALGVAVELHPLGELGELPHWLSQEQATLF